MNFFQKIKDGLSKTKQAMISRFQKVINSFTKIDEDLFEELEETMIMSDIGVDTSVEICEQLRKKVKERGITNPNEIMGLIQEIIADMMGDDTAIDISTTPSIIMVIGVNGVGKTTTIGKLCYQYRQQGKKVLVAAADTFRAAAIDQLEIWTKRAGVELVKHSEGSDPGAVIFDAITAGKARGADIIICDTAGRLHNKKNLMNELSKINRIVSQQAEGCARETLLVLDATTGQNAVNQAKMFSETADITGIVLTKLDGTAKGGIVISIKNELNIPVKLIGVGEKIDDLQPFNSADFVKALFDMDLENAEKSNYDRIDEDIEVTTKEDFSIVPDTLPIDEKSVNKETRKSKSAESTEKTSNVEDEHINLEDMDNKEIIRKIQEIKSNKDKNKKKSKLKEKSVVEETPIVEKVEEKSVIEETPIVEKVEENPVIEETPTVEKVEENPIIEETSQTEKKTVAIEPIQRTAEKYIPIIDEKFIDDSSPTLEFEKVNPNPVDTEEFKPVIEDTPTVVEDEPVPNIQEVEPLSDDDYYQENQDSEYLEDDSYYDDDNYYDGDQYYDDDYYYEDGQYYDDEYPEDEYYDDYQEVEAVQEKPKKKESFFSKLFGKNKDKSKKDKSNKKDKNNKKNK